MISYITLFSSLTTNLNNEVFTVHYKVSVLHCALLISLLIISGFVLYSKGYITMDLLYWPYNTFFVKYHLIDSTYVYRDSKGNIFHIDLMKDSLEYYKVSIEIMGDNGIELVDLLQYLHILEKIQ